MHIRAFCNRRFDVEMLAQSKRRMFKSVDPVTGKKAFQMGAVIIMALPVSGSCSPRNIRVQGTGEI